MTAQEQEQDEVSEAQIAVHWREEEYFYPPTRFVGQANAADPAIRDRFREEQFPECFKEYADLLSWDSYWHTTLDTSNAPFWRWFVGGRLNACYNCVDRHLADRANQAAFIWVPEPESDPTEVITYRELYRRVNEFAALLRDFAGVKVGDRVTFHLPMVPELPDRHAGLRPARRHPLPGVRRVQRGGVRGTHRRLARAGSWSPWTATTATASCSTTRSRPTRRWSGPGRKASRSTRCWCGGATRASTRPKAPWSRAGTSSSTRSCRTFAGKIVEPVSMPAEAPLFIMYSSGTTGRPKGCQHSTGGYLSYVAGTSKYYLDIHPEDTYWCFADIGWITGHSYIVYGPLALGTTSVMYEGVPTYPDAGPAVAHRRAARGQHLPHRADDHPDAAQVRSGRAGQVRLPLQADDDGGRAHRTRGVALVLRVRRQG